MDLAVNKKAGFDYEIMDKIEAGIILKGHEVKSARSGGAKLSGAYVVPRGPRFWLIRAHISKLKQAGSLPGYEPDRSRELLLKKQEIRHLIGKAADKHLTFIPLKLYTEAGKIKLQFAVARHKKKYEKREQIKRRETERQIRSSLRRT